MFVSICFPHLQQTVRCRSCCCCSLPHGLCYIETSNLDGETNLKILQVRFDSDSLVSLAVKTFVSRSAQKRLWNLLRQNLYKITQTYDFFQCEITLPIRTKGVETEGRDRVRAAERSAVRIRGHDAARRRQGQNFVVSETSITSARLHRGMYMRVVDRNTKRWEQKGAAARLQSAQHRVGLRRRRVHRRRDEAHASI